MTNGTTIRAGATDRIRLAGNSFAEAVSPSNNSTHLASADNLTHICSSTHGHNTKRLTSTTASVDGGGSVSLPIITSSCPLLISFFSFEKVVTSLGKIFSYNGVSDTIPMTGANIYLAEGGVSTSWVQAHGVANALTLADQNVASEEHNFYIAISTEGNGASSLASGALKVTISYI